MSSVVGLQMSYLRKKLVPLRIVYKGMVFLQNKFWYVFSEYLSQKMTYYTVYKGMVFLQNDFCCGSSDELPEEKLITLCTREFLFSRMASDVGLQMCFLGKHPATLCTRVWLFSWMSSDHSWPSILWCFQKSKGYLVYNNIWQRCYRKYNIPGPSQKVTPFFPLIKVTPLSLDEIFSL